MALRSNVDYTQSSKRLQRKRAIAEQRVKCANEELDEWLRHDSQLCFAETCGAQDEINQIRVSMLS